jgi:ubiquinone/menaquinone biosynthesis C-methylase UbiE
MDKNDRDAINREQERFFDQAVDLFDGPQPTEVIDRLRQIVEMADIREGDTLLDVGAGVGVFVPLFDPYKPSRVVACDLSGKMLQRLKEKFPDVETHQKDIIDLNIEDETIDVIFMNAMFSNVAAKEIALSKCACLLKKGGRLIISHPEGRDFIRKLQKVVSFRLDLLPTYPNLRNLLGELPLKIVRYIDRPKLYFSLAERI